MSAFEGEFPSFVEGAESEEEMLKRHKKEVKEMEGRQRAHAKHAKKTKQKKADMDAAIAGMASDLAKKHGAVSVTSCHT